jgi:predicted RNase H-like HicB family nuclease
MTHGDTYEEALAMAQEAMRAWIDVAAEVGKPVPVPKGRRLMYA